MTKSKSKDNYELNINSETSFDNIKKFIEESGIGENVKNFKNMPLNDLLKILFVISKIGMDDNKEICKFLENYFKEKNLIDS